MKTYALFQCDHIFTARQGYITDTFVQIDPNGYCAWGKRRGDA